MNTLTQEIARSSIEAFFMKLGFKGFYIRPSRDFYNSLNIRQKRFWQLVKGEKSPTMEELEAISDYFNVDISELL